MGTYLITGGAGFIGSHLAEALVARGERVKIIDDLSTGRRENIESFAERVELIEGDIRDREAVEAAIDGADYVLHQAALASVQRSIDDPTRTNQVNVQGTLNLLEAANAAGVKRFVYASSSSAYGDSEVLPKLEIMIPNPKSPYAVSKLAAEWYCGVFADIFGMTTVSLRYFNIFGPRQDPNSPYSAVIPIFVKHLIQGKSPTIYGDGEQSRDFTYIDNVVQANLLACDADISGAHVYNVACGERFTLNLLYDRIKNMLGVDNEPNYGPPRQGDVKHSQASIEAIQKGLGYETRVGFDDGLIKTVGWFREDGVIARS